MYTKIDLIGRQATKIKTFLLSTKIFYCSINNKFVYFFSYITQ
jgi:hypothetical protein